MEKLEPILKQKFWILLGLGVVMTLTGWWLATGTLAASIDARTTKVKAAFDQIPSGEIPNSDWSTKLAARNTEQDRSVRNTAALLWERQQQRMTWPDSVADFTKKIEYRGEIPLAARENYRLAYGYDVRRVWESVRPFIQVDGSGVVLYGQNEKVLPQRTWGQLAPSSAEMWDAQEDLWLLESLLQSIVEVNGRDGLRADASIHVIEKLELCGGLPASQRKAAPSGGPGSTGMPGSAGAHGAAGAMTMGAPAGFGNESGMGTGMGMGAGGRSGMSPLPSADFDRTEEFGSDGSGGARGMGGGFPGAAGAAGAHAASATGMPGATPGAAAANTVRRYIEDDAALPFKTRGFYMTVIMDHRKIPSFIAELSASEKSAWPVEVVRVQWVRLHDDDVGTGSGVMGTGGGKPFSLSSLSATGAMGSSGYPANPGGFEPVNEGSGSFNNPTFGASGDPNTNNSTISQAAAGVAALESALQDPFMARVALCGFITLYKEVKPEPVVAAAGTQAAPAAAPAANPEVDPAATATGAESVPAGTVPAGTVPEGSVPATNPGGATPESTAPAAEAVPSTDANPETPPAQPPGTPTTKPPAEPTPQKPAAAAAAGNE
jgi:hypothetical protein